MAKKLFAKPEKYLEPLDLSATVGQSCVSVCVCVKMCVEERRCGGVPLKSPRKNTHSSLYPQTYISLIFNKNGIFKHVFHIVIPS